MSPIIEIKTIQYMQAIEREGGFQKAAESLYISQPALSQYIKKIETELGTPLYYRNKGKCFLTETGKIVLTQGQRVLQEYDTMLEEIEASSGLKEVLLGWPTGYSTKYYNSLISYMHENKSVRIQVLEDSVEGLTTRLLSRELDVIFVPAIYSHPKLQYCTINHEEFMVAIPKNHEANRIAKEHQVDGALDLRYLLKMPFLMVEAKAYQDFFHSLFRGCRKEPDIYFRCMDWERGCMIAAQGSCLIIAPEWYRNFEPCKDDLDFYRINSRHHNYRIFAATTRDGSTIKPETQTVIDSMITLCGDNFAGQPVPEEFLTSAFNF